MTQPRKREKKKKRPNLGGKKAQLRRKKE